MLLQISQYRKKCRYVAEFTFVIKWTFFPKKLKQNIRSMILFLQFITKQTVCDITPNCVKIYHNDQKTSSIL